MTGAAQQCLHCPLDPGNIQRLLPPLPPCKKDILWIFKLAKYYLLQGGKVNVLFFIPCCNNSGMTIPGLIAWKLSWVSHRGSQRQTTFATLWLAWKTSWRVTLGWLELDGTWLLLQCNNTHEPDLPKLKKEPALPNGNFSILKDLVIGTNCSSPTNGTNHYFLAGNKMKPNEWKDHL